VIGDLLTRPQATGSSQQLRQNDECPCKEAGDQLQTGWKPWWRWESPAALNMQRGEDPPKTQTGHVVVEGHPNVKTDVKGWPLVL